MFLKFTVFTLSLLTLAAAACDTVGLGGSCYHGATGEELKQVRDANGDLFSVSKHDTGLTMLGQDLVFCAISKDAKLGGEGGFGYSGYVYHPETGERIEAHGLQRGKRIIGEFEYEWY